MITSIASTSLIDSPVTPPLPAEAATPAALFTRLPALLAAEAPYLETKLVRLGVVEDGPRARALFQEVKKYLFLTELHRDRRIDMFSTRVDEAWHQFALFTLEYARFCATHFGRFVHHFPAEAPDPASEGVRPSAMGRDEFAAAYAEHFGPLGDEWYDERQLSDDSCLTHAPWAQPLHVETDGRAVLHGAGERPGELCRVNLRAAQALQFIADHCFFFVRELPGLASAEERIELCRPLTRFGILKVAP